MVNVNLIEGAIQAYVYFQNAIVFVVPGVVNFFENAFKGKVDFLVRNIFGKMTFFCLVGFHNVSVMPR